MPNRKFISLHDFQGSQQLFISTCVLLPLATKHNRNKEYLYTILSKTSFRLLKMYSKVSDSQISLPTSPGGTRKLIDHNGNRYVELDYDFIMDPNLSKSCSIFQCTKKDSQGCMGKIALYDQYKTVRVIQFHSCRWSYDEASKFCYLRYGVNKFIKTGYHHPVQTWQERWNLLWSIHSETWNIWTHVIGIVISAYCLWNSIFFMNGSDHWILVLHDLAGLATFLKSTAYHWLHTCSERWCKNLGSLDFWGIANFVFVICFNCVYYGWRHKPFYFYFYASILGIILLLKSIISMKNIVARKFDYKLEDYRLKLVIAPVITMFLSQFHQLVVYKTCDFLTSECCIYILFITLSYVIATITYGMQLPEALWPGRFDTIFNGHQIMHVMIVCSFILQRWYLDCIRFM